MLQPALRKSAFLPVFRLPTTSDLMFKPQMALWITALACSNLLAAPPVRKFDDPGAPPFKVLKDGEKPPLDK
jgi:hypothetical protein